MVLLLSLPADVLGSVLVRVSQLDLVSLAQCCAELHTLANGVLYRNVLVAIGATTPLRSGSRAEFLATTPWHAVGCTVVFSAEKALALHALLIAGDALPRILASFEWQPSGDEHAETERRFAHLLAAAAPNLTRVAFSAALMPLFSSHRCLASANLAATQGSLHVRQTTLTPAEARSWTDWDVLHRMEKLEFRSGVDVCPLVQLHTRLTPKELTFSHSHTDGASALDFAALERTVDLAQVRTLRLSVDCLVSCRCLGRFAEQLCAYLAQQRGMPRLTLLELRFLPQSEWLGPSDLVEEVLTPFGNFVKTLCALQHLTVDFAAPLYKMYSESGMPLLYLNLRCNEKLLEAFFLPLCTDSPTSVSRTLRSLALPDFFMLLVYYKPNFYESFLHTCRCAGCALVLAMLQEQFPLGDEDIDSEEASMYVLVGLILAKLQHERPLLARRQVLGAGTNTLHLHLHRHTPCQCGALATLATGSANAHATHATHVVDALATTYVVHQCRPIADYLAQIFQGLTHLTLHGVHYARGNGMQCVFDEETFPALPAAPACAPQRPYGHFSLVLA